MSNENNTVNIEDNVIYFYYVNGEKFWTPNPTFAQSRSNTYGDGKVYVQKVG